MSDKEKLKYYLEAMEKLLTKQSDSHYVLDILGESIEEPNNNFDFFGDGYCLLEEIQEELEEADNDK